MAEETDADKIKDIMAIHDLTLEALANKLGVSLNTVWKWASGKCIPSRLAKEKIKSVFGKY